MNKNIGSKKGFTLVELLVAIGVVAVLATTAVIAINPAQLLAQGRDSNRLSDISSLTLTLSDYKSMGGSLGSSGTIYVSIPDPLATSTTGDQCQGLNLPALPTSSGFVYHCAPPSTVNNIDGTGWIPVNLKSMSPASPITILPKDPVNASSSCDYYTYTTDGNNYEISANVESQKQRPAMAADGGQFLSLYEKGSSPSLLPVDPTGGTIYVASYWGGVFGSGGDIGQISGCTFTQTGTVGSGGSGVGQFQSAESVAVDPSGDIYGVDYYSSGRVEKFDPSGNYISTIGTTGGGVGQIGRPSGVAVDSGGNIYVVDEGNARVEKFDPSGNYVLEFGSFGTGNGQFQYPVGGIVVDSSGNIYVDDYYDYRIEKFNPSGGYITQFGSFGTGNGQFITPDGIAIDPNGNIWVGDNNDAHIQEFNASGTYMTQFGSAGTGNGQFAFGNGVNGMVIDKAGNFYISDYSNNRVEKFNASGTYMTQVSFYEPAGVAIAP